MNRSSSALRPMLCLHPGGKSSLHSGCHQRYILALPVVCSYEGLLEARSHNHQPPRRASRESTFGVPAPVTASHPVPALYPVIVIGPPGPKPVTVLLPVVMSWNPSV